MFSELWWIEFKHEKLGDVRLAGMRKPENDTDMQSLSSSNVIGIISLLDDEENHELYERHEMDFLWLAVKGGGAPAKAQVVQANEYITAKLSEGKDVIVSTHCNGGRKRTGTLLAGVMVLNGVEAKKAVSIIETANPEIKLKDEQIAFLEQLAALRA